MADTDAIRLTLAVRTLAPRGADAQTDLIERVRSLADREGVEDVEVLVWGDRVPLTGPAADTDHARDVLATVDRFREWADDHGVDLDRFFRRRERHSEYTGDAETVLELPSVALAEYRGEDLHRVAPCRDPDGAVESVRDRLATIERHLDRDVRVEGASRASRTVVGE